MDILILRAVHGSSCGPGDVGPDKRGPIRRCFTGRTAAVAISDHYYDKTPLATIHSLGLARFGAEAPICSLTARRIGQAGLRAAQLGLESPH